MKLGGVVMSQQVIVNSVNSYSLLSGFVVRSI